MLKNRVKEGWRRPKSAFMKNYYDILGLPRDATEGQIRKAYRRLALQWHPDRNRGDPQAEARFKDIAEAYGVLVDPVKRRDYDRWRSAGPQERAAGGGFRYSREEIFQDLFRDPRFNAIFQDLFKEFQKAGVRSDRRFFNHVFFGGRGIIFGGLFFWGPSGWTRVHGPAQPSTMEGQGATPLKASGLLKKLGRKILGSLVGNRKALPDTGGGAIGLAEDLSYRLSVSREKARQGAWVSIAVDRGEGQETLRVKIPPGTKSGTRLRLRGKGTRGSGQKGNLYLIIHTS
jgi:DnaJ-class molecular chaperone